MFTIEQAGSIKKVNTIDELIIEYIRQYACKCNSNSGGNLNAEELNSYLNNALKGVATEEYVNQVINSIDLSEYATLTTLDAYAKKDDIPTIPDDLVNNDTLATTLSNYINKDNIINLANDYETNTYEITETINCDTGSGPSNYFKLTKFIEDGDIVKFTYNNINYEHTWKTQGYEDADELTFKSSIIEGDSTGIAQVHIKKSNEYIMYIAFDGDTNCEHYSNITITTKTMGKKSDELPLSADAVSNRIADTLTNYATLTNLDEYATKSDIPTDYVNNDTLNDYVKKDTIIDEFMKEVELNLSNQGDMSYVMQLHNDENIRQATIDNGIDIDAYLTSDSSITFKGHFDYAKTENNKLYFSNGTQVIYVDAYSDDSSCCIFYYNSIRVAINKISTKILLDEYTDDYANNIPSMKYINNTLTNYAKLTNLEADFVKTSNIVKSNIVTEPIEYEENTITNFEAIAYQVKSATIHINATIKETNEDISGNYVYYDEDLEFWNFKKIDDSDNSDNRLSIYWRYWEGGITYHDSNNKRYDTNYISITELSYTHETNTFPDDNIPSVNYVSDNFIRKEGDATITGDVTIKNQCSNQITARLITLDTTGDNTAGRLVSIVFGSSEMNKQAVKLEYLYDNTDAMHYYFLSQSSYTLSISPELMHIKPSIDVDGSSKFNNDLTIKGNLIVDGTITSAQSNTTITHYTPIEQDLNAIDDFIIGAPVYITGKVYKYVENKFVLSTENDTTDCICSVKTNGKWNTFIGICTSIDADNKCIVFASGGDYLVKVDDSSCYAIGDEVFIDDDNKLKILTGATAITSKIRRTTVGIITGIINDTTLSVFKS